MFTLQSAFNCNAFSTKSRTILLTLLLKYQLKPSHQDMICFRRNMPCFKLHTGKSSGKICDSSSMPYVDNVLVYPTFHIHILLGLICISARTKQWCLKDQICNNRLIQFQLIIICNCALSSPIKYKNKFFPAYKK